VQTLLFGFALAFGLAAFGLAFAFALGFGVLKLLLSGMTLMRSLGSNDGLSSRRNAGHYLDAEKEA
jgi:hypothetical protein